MSTDSQIPRTPAQTERNPALLSPMFAALFPAGVVAAEMRGPGTASLLLPDEAAYVARAVPKRVQEFAAGRLCARRAMAEFGVVDFPLRCAEDRRPLWPASLVGSITHTGGLCAAVVAERARFAGLGVDSEVIGDAKPALWPTICTPAETEWLDALPAAERPAAATLVFVAKEAFYKFQYPLAGERLDFHDVRVIPAQWGSGCGSFALEPTRAIAVLDGKVQARGTVQGCYRLHQQFASAGVFLAA